MENASKALVMAGSVLIAIIIISLLVKTYGKIGAFNRQETATQEVERIEKFNKQFTKYQDQYVYGTEVISTINRALDLEEPVVVYLEFETDYDMNITVYENGIKDTKPKKVTAGSTLGITNKDVDNKDFYSGLMIGKDSALLVDSVDEITSLKSRAFKCTEIKYREDGMVKSIKFVEKKYN